MNGGHNQNQISDFTGALSQKGNNNNNNNSDNKVRKCRIKWNETCANITCHADFSGKFVLVVKAK